MIPSKNNEGGEALADNIIFMNGYKQGFNEGRNSILRWVREGIAPIRKEESMEAHAAGLKQEAWNEGFNAALDSLTTFLDSLEKNGEAMAVGVQHAAAAQQPSLSDAR